jgi:hypothetical protein
MEQYDYLRNASKLADELEAAKFIEEADSIRNCFNEAGTRLEMFMMIRFCLAKLSTEKRVPKFLIDEISKVHAEFSAAIDKK